MIPVLYEPTATSFNTYGIGALPDAISPHVVEERNGEYTFDMQYPIDGINFEHIGMRSIITAKPNPYKAPQPFRVVRISKPINGIVTIYARHIRYDLEGVPVSPFTANNITDALSAIESHMMVDNPFHFYTDKTTNVRMNSTVPRSALSLMGGQEGSLLDIYGGEYDYDVFNVDLLNHRGQETNVVIRYGVNLVDLEQEENCSNVYTGALAFWKSYDTDQVVTGDIQSAGTFDFTKIKVIDKSDDYEDAPTVAQLNVAAVNYINTNNIGVPRISINLKFQQAEELEINGNQLNLCDYVTVSFEKLGVSARAKIIRTDYDVMNERYISLDIGDSRTTMADTIIGISTKAESAPTTAQMQQAINMTTAAILGANGGAVRLLDTNNDGVPDTLYIADNQNPELAEKVWRFNYEGWGASQNGYDGPFTMGATFAQGFLADFITAGTLDAANISVENLSATSITVGTLSADRIQDNSLANIKLVDSTIEAGKIANSTITGSKIAKTTITGGSSGNIGDSVISTFNVTDGIGTSLGYADTSHRVFTGATGADTVSTYGIMDARTGAGYTPKTISFYDPSAGSTRTMTVWANTD